MMLQIGKDERVEVSEIVGLTWDSYTERMPLVLLRGGHTLRADNFEVESDLRRNVEVRQEALNRLEQEIDNARWPFKTR